MFKKENLRKNFLRVKQNIDQNLGRAEQSKVLTEDQQENEKRVDLVKHAFQNIAKKAGAVMQASGTDVDKKLKKLPEMALGHAMVESAQSLGTDTLLGNVCQLCGDCQMNLAREQVQYEMTAEQEFIAPLQTVVDVDIPSIMKFRKALSKSILDMDSAKTRLNQVVRQCQVPGANMANAAAKADVIKEEYEEATLKMENIKDSLSIELCNFAAKECEHSSTLLKFLEAQASYHKKALEIIADCIPQMQVAIKNSAAKPCFGMPLEEHLRLMCRDVALVLEACIITLLETGMEEEGLFRIAGSAVKLKKLKASFDAHVVDMEEFSTDQHTVAGALKQYLRELPEPLLTFELYDDFLQTAVLPQDQRLQSLWTVINRLPKPNYNNFRYLVKFLAKLAEKSDVNKMKPSNIAIVIGPNLLWSEKCNTPNMMSTGTVSAIIEAVVTHADWFFPGAFDFHLTSLGSSPKQCREPGFALNIKSESSNTKSSKETEKTEETIEVVRTKMTQKKTNQEKAEIDNANEDGNRVKIPAVNLPNFDLRVKIPSVIPTAAESQMRKPRLASAEDDDDDDDDSSCEENNPFSEKVGAAAASDTDMKTERGKAGINDYESSGPLLVGDKRNGHYIRSRNSYTGDYDNIFYTMSHQNPLYRSSTFNKTSLVCTPDRRGSADNVLTYGKHNLAPVPPSRPSRISKRTLPLVSEQHSPYSAFALSMSQSTHPGSQQSIEAAYKSPGPHLPNEKYLIGSTPNICSLLYNRMEDDEYAGYHGSPWNRPNQKSDFESLKRGSDPCIIPPPSQFSISNSQKSSKFSRSQLGAPPKPGEMSRSQPSTQFIVSPNLGEMSRSQPSPQLVAAPNLGEMSRSQPSPQLVAAPNLGEMSRSQQSPQLVAAPNLGEMSRSQPSPQLVAPPNLGEISRSQASPRSEMSRSPIDQNLPQSSKSYDATPVDKSFHQDAYSTAFALTSLGAGSKSTDYLTRVRAMWDDRHLQNTKFNTATEKTTSNKIVIETNTKGLDHSSSVSKADKSAKPDSTPLIDSTQRGFSQSSPEGDCTAVGDSPCLTPASSHAAEVDFNMGYLYDECLEGNQTQLEKSQNSTETLHCQVVPVHQLAHNSVQSPSPGASPVPSSNSSSGSLPLLSESPDSTSPLQRRGTRKPAPPPPPDRSYIVNVTATTAGAFKPRNSTSIVISSSSNGEEAVSANGNPFQTWPRSAPLASPESPTDQHSTTGGQEKDRQKLSGNQLDRSSVQLHHRPDQAPPERPRAPPSLNPPVAVRGHQRSISAGAVFNQKIGTFDSNITAGVPNAGSLSSYSITEVNQDDNEGVGSNSVNSAANIQNVVPSVSSHTLGRQTSMRPRPSPPPPPPPTSKDSEDTKL